MKRDGVIFLLENSTDYLFLLDQSFRRSQIINPLRVARYGNEAILYLKGVGIYSDRSHYPLPEFKRKGRASRKSAWPVQPALTSSIEEDVRC